MPGISGSEIKDIRKALNMTQKEFSDFTGVSKPTIERWEADKSPVTGPIVPFLTLLRWQPSLTRRAELPEKRLRLRLIYMYESIICTVIDVDETLRQVEIHNYADSVMLRAFGPNTEPTYEEYEEFLESRCFPPTRDKMKLELERLSIPFYDPLLIIEKTEGRMAEDRFWIRIEK